MPDDRIPEILQTLVAELALLPGFGRKSAMRVAMKLLEWPKEKTQTLGQHIFELRDRLSLCSRCYGLTEANPCAICSDPMRHKNSLCLVPEWDSMLTIDKGAFYHGQYFVLGGLIAPLEHSDADKLNIDPLLQRLAEGEVTELIFALGSTSDAETTTAWIAKLVHERFPAVQISRLAQGLPLGAEVKYMDQETLRQSLQFRQPL